MRTRWFLIPVLACGLAVLAAAQDSGQPADSAPASPVPAEAKATTPDALSEELRELEREAGRVAVEIRRAQAEGRGDQRSVAELRTRLGRVVNLAFDRRQHAQRAEVEELRNRLQAVEQTISARDSSKQQIVEHRIVELLNPELRWESGDAAAPPVAPFRQPAPESAGPRPSGAEKFESRDRPAEALPPAAPDRGLELPGLIGRGGQAAGGEIMLRSPTEFGTKLAEAAAEFAYTQRLEQKGLTDADSVEFARRKLRLLRDEYAAQIRLLEIELEDAESMYNSVRDSMARAERLYRTGQIPQTVLTSQNRTVAQARSRVLRLDTLLDLYRKAGEPAGSESPAARPGASGPNESVPRPAAEPSADAEEPARAP